MERAAELKEEGNKQYSSRDFKKALSTWEQARGDSQRAGPQARAWRLDKHTTLTRVIPAAPACGTRLF